MKHQRVFLVGPMGAGKSTVGRLLASRLGFGFVDTDHVIEDRTGADIPWIFDVEGEEGFRDRESAVIAELVQRKNLVLATGGGAMMRPENRQQAGAHGFVVYLNTSVAQQVQRTLKDKNRPLLQGKEDPKLVLRRLFEVRDPIYREVADLVVKTDRKSLKSIVRQICNAVKEP